MSSFAKAYDSLRQVKMSTPKTFMALAAEWKETTYLDGPACAEQLEALIREWGAQINAGIEKRKTEQPHIGPLYTMGTNRAAEDIKQQILGLPAEKP